MTMLLHFPRRAGQGKGRASVVTVTSNVLSSLQAWLQFISGRTHLWLLSFSWGARFQALCLPLFDYQANPGT